MQAERIKDEIVQNIEFLNIGIFNWHIQFNNISQIGLDN